jgi:DNA-binding response OmpR family regulator
VAQSCAEAEALVMRETYGLILLDLVLGKEDGLAILRRIRARRRAPIVIISGKSDSTDIITGLERDGIAVRAVAGGREALAMIRAMPPRLIVLDVGLPDIDGFDLVAILRSDETLRGLPLLVYTGRDLDGADRARLTLGPTRFLTKSTADDREFRRLVGELIRPVEELTS